MQSALAMERPAPPASTAASASSADEHGQSGSGALAPLAPDPQEREWIERAQRGDGDAFRELVERHQQRAFRIARHLTPNDEDARDLVQEAFLRVFRNIERFDFEHSFSTWLHRIVTNLAIDHLRRRRVVAKGLGGTSEAEEFESEFDPLDPRAATPADRLDAAETGRKVRECIAALAPHFQSVLLLREIEGLPCNEIAKLVGATHVTVRWRLHRGRKLFQEEWERRERAEDSSRAGSASRAAQTPRGVRGSALPPEVDQ